MRKVKYRRPINNDDWSDFIHEATFLQWITSCRPGTPDWTCAVALIELPDGTVEEVLPSNIRFEKEQSGLSDKYSLTVYAGVAILHLCRKSIVGEQPNRFNFMKDNQALMNFVHAEVLKNWEYDMSGAQMDYIVNLYLNGSLTHKL